ncbi:hypothetical protein I3760_06G065100 [Carya illinoinensis]|nr:hypothetical protein I3760_06G065100 [Carya illinoinensis]
MKSFEKWFMRLKSCLQASVQLNSFHTWDGLLTGSLAGFEDSKRFFVIWMIIDVLLRIERDQRTNTGAPPFNKDNIKAILFDMFLGGSNTAAVTMLWSMAELAKNPRAMKKAQDEVRNVVGNRGNVTESDITHLHYLKMIIKETFRLHPPAAILLPRLTMTDVKIGGYDIGPNSLLQVNAWALGRDPEYWKNPEEFYPEGSLIALSSIKDNILSYCHLDLVEEVVLGYTWERPPLSFHLRIFCIVSIGKCPQG